MIRQAGRFLVDYHVLKITTGLYSRSARGIILGPKYCPRAEQIAIEAPRASLRSSTKHPPSRLRGLKFELGPEL